VFLAKYYYGNQIRDEREWTSRMYWREEKCIEETYVGKTLQGRDLFGDNGVYESTLLKWIKKYDGRKCPGFIWVKIRINDFY
jgi:hypothetical protein